MVINLETANPTINCAGDNTGTIVATAQGGLANYIYTLEDTLGNTISATQNSPGVFTELLAGNYVVNVDSEDCNASVPVTITEPSAPLNATITVGDITCNGANDGVLEVTATGGTGVIQYAISPQMDQFFSTNIFENLEAGDYQVIVQDELGCYQIFDFTINEPDPVLISIVPGSLIPEECSGEFDGEFSIEISGGTMPYSVSLDSYDGPYTTGTATQILFDFTDLAGGDHTVFVRDAEGCESEWNITFPESVTINPEVLVEYICVENASENLITVLVDDSVDPNELQYSLNGGPFQASNIFQNVVPGLDNYIEVSHTNGCTQTTELFDVGEYLPVAIALNETEQNHFTALATGGTGDYTFTMNDEDYGSTNTFMISESGEYTVTVTDTNGCFASASIYLDYFDPCIPNYFTPNGDGVQDGWAPCTDDFPNLEFDIYDRYGRKVGTYHQGQYWDGRYNGKELPTGDYWYVVRLNSSNNDKEYVGHFTLYR